MSTEQPPKHMATYIFQDANPPTFVNVAVQAVYKWKGRIQSKPLGWFDRVRRRLWVVRNMRTMHVITRLNAKVDNVKRDWFKYPADGKFGCNLKIEATLKNGGLRILSPARDERWRVNGSND